MTELEHVDAPLRIGRRLGEHFPVPVYRMGMPDHFGESGEPGELLEKYGLTAKHIELKVHTVLSR